MANSALILARLVNDHGEAVPVEQAPVRQRIAEFIVARFGLEYGFVSRRLDIFLTLVPLTDAQLSDALSFVKGESDAGRS